MRLVGMPDLTFEREPGLRHHPLRRDVRRSSQRNQRLAIEVLETEPYAGQRDLGCQPLSPVRRVESVPQLDFVDVLDVQVPQTGATDDLRGVMPAEQPEPESIRVPMRQVPRKVGFARLEYRNF